MASHLPPAAKRGEGRGGGPIITIRPRHSWLAADVVAIVWVFSTLPLLVVAGGLVLHPRLALGLPVGAKLALGTFVVIWAGLLWLTRQLARSMWHVELYEEWVAMRLPTRGGVQVGARWQDLAWFDDSDHHVVRLRLRDAQILEIPLETPNEAERVAVLDFLVRKGVPRRDV